MSGSSWRCCFECETLKIIAATLAVGVALATGCQSGRQAGTASHASVKIDGRPLTEIRQTTSVVFREGGYTLAANTPQQMVFERLGSRRDVVKWGGWTEGGVVMRIKVDIIETAGGACLLQANAYAVQNSDDPFFRTESRNVLLNRAPYQKLLNEVRRRVETEGKTRTQ